MLLGLSAAAAASTIEKARLFYRIGDWKKAAASCEALPGEGLAESDLLWCAEAFLEAGDLKKARRLLESVQTQGENTENKVLMQLIAAQEGSRSEAAEGLASLSSRFPRDGRVLAALARVWWTVDIDRALSFAHTATEVQPDQFQAWFVLGTIQEDKENFAEAAKAYRKAASLNPMSAAAHNNLGYAYKEMHFYRYAIEEYEKAIELMPDKPGYYYNIGNAYAHEDMIDEALQAYRTAVQLEPTFAKAHYNLGRTYLRKDRVEEAVDAFKAYLKYATKAVFDYVATRSAVESEIDLLERYLEANPSMKARRKTVDR